MTRPRLYLLFAVLTALGVFLFLQPDDEDKILARLETLRALAEVQGPETAIDQIARARQISRYFSDRTVYDLRNAGYAVIEVDGQQDLVQRILKIRAALTSLELTMQEPAVRIDGQLATVELAGGARGTTRHAGQPFLEMHDIEILLEKSGDDWRVSGARHIRDLRAAPQP